jgi:hypothetical protein
MANTTKHKTKKANNNDAAIKPDPETLHTTDPQEHMKGPISSPMHKIEETMEDVGEDKPQKEKKK